ncbi:unnamed protein product [Lupinus luteus]|uniref:RRM domain-containing protein n=1 Tax=Lupinus luteus TaxID=3873 RepID=A0AAV1X3I9_LUPLU
MDFDEYEYLEKTVENLDDNETPNGNGTVKSEDKDRSRRSKHSKSGDAASRDDDRVKHRGSPRHRSRSRDEEKVKDRNRSSGGERDRRRDDKDRERHGRERDRRDRGSEGEREREKEHSQRSRTKSERHPTELVEQDQETGRGGREYRERDRIRDRDYRGERESVREPWERDRENRRHKEKKEDGAEPEADPERDQRTVFAYQVSLKADERDVYELFSRAGKVRDVRLIMDRNSRRSKGFGYIEFYDAMSVPMAIALSGQPLLGQPVMVKPSEAEKNLVQSTASVAGGTTGGIGPYSGGARRLYVGNLHFSMTEADLRSVFEAFGQVELVQLPPDESGHCKGFGFVQFARLEDARNAQGLNGLEIGGRTIKVSAITTDQAGMLEVGGNTGEFDDEEGGGLYLNASSRALLMQKLDRSGTTSSMVGSTGNSAVNNTGLNLPATGNIPAATLPGAVPAGSSIPAVPGLPGVGLQFPTAAATIPSIDTIGVPSECLWLKNMFDPNDEKEPDFDFDIKEDVEAECSKFGKLRHIYVDKKSAGFVFLRFENTQSAISAQVALHGRWFAGKMITASFMVPQSYEDKFPDSR